MFTRPNHKLQRVKLIRSIAFLTATWLLLTPATASAKSDEAIGLSAQLYDLIIQRPVGLVETSIGLAVTTVMMPIAYPARRSQQLIEHCVKEPVRYTFRRKLGDFRQNPEDQCSPVGAGWSVVGLTFGIIERPLGFLFGRSPFSRDEPPDQAEI